MIQEDAMNIYADRKGKDTGKAPERSAKGASCAGNQTPQSKSFPRYCGKPPRQASALPGRFFLEKARAVPEIPTSAGDFLHGETQVRFR